MSISKYVFALSLLLLSSLNDLTAQHYPTNYFRSPLDIPLFAAGTFGELRPNHFHSGLDIKTNGVEGLNVYAVADGYVSRIRVQANGFGKAIYITHPNGYTSVYGHLSKFNAEIGRYVKEIQYQRESFEVDLQIKPSQFPIKKSDIIALSGNTGNSGGAHLHFELRDSKTEAIINPLLFGFPIADKQPPTLKSIMISPESPISHVNRNDKPLKIKLLGQNGTYTIENKQPINVYGKIGISLQAFDTQDGSSSENGVYSIELNIDGKPYYTFVTEKFLFSDTRYINAHTDFEEQQKTKNFFQRCFLLPNNKLECYRTVVNRGFGNFYDINTHAIELIVKDVAGNTSTLYFRIKGDGIPLQRSLENCLTIFPYNNVNAYKTNDFRIVIPQNTLFDSLCFQYSSDPSIKGCYSKLHHVGNPFVPVFSSFSISILPTTLQEKYYSKALLAIFDAKGFPLPQGGSYENGFVTAKVSKFGSFGIVIDTTPPAIKPLNMRLNMTTANDIRFHIADNCSGIQSYRFTVDGKWILAELDGKTGTLTYTFDEHVSKGRHHLKLLVTDNKNNTRKYEALFSR